MKILNGGRNLMLYTCTGYEPRPKTPEEIERDRVRVENWNRQRNHERQKYIDTIRAKTDAELVKDAEDENNVDYDAGGPNTDELIRRYKIYAGIV